MEAVQRSGSDEDGRKWISGPACAVLGCWEVDKKECGDGPATVSGD